MKSTIRFNSNNSYNCKQTNIISSTDIASIEQVNGNNVLVSQSNINIDFDTDNKDVDFTMTVKNISVSKATKLSCYVAYGYTRQTTGNIFMIDASTTAKDLVITKSGNTSTITFGGSVIDTKNSIAGPIKELEIKNIIEDVSSISDIVDIRIGDIIYESN